MLRTRLLEVAAAQFSTRNLSRDCQHGHAIAMTVVQPIDEMEIARTTTASAHGEFAGEMGLGTCGKGCHLFVTNVQPIDLVALADDFGQSVERVANNPIDAFDACRNQSL